MVPAVAVHSFRSRVLATGAAVVVLVVTLLGYDAWRGYRRAIDDAFRETENLTNVFEESTLRTLQGIDNVLSNLTIGSTKIDLREDDIEPRLIGTLVQQLRNFPQVASFGVIDETGSLLASTRPTWDRTLSFSDRDYFYLHRDAAVTGLFVGTLLKSRITGEWLFIVSRKLDKPGGGFGGVVYATMDLAYFASLYAGINVGANGSVTLLHRDGAILARAPEHDDFIGQSVASGDFYREHLQRADRGSARTRLAVGQRDLILSYRSISPTPLVVAVGFAASDVLADWRRSLTGYLATAAGLLALIAASVILLIHGRERQAALVEAMRAREQAQREADRMAQIQRVEEQLHRAQKMEAVGQLTGGIAHDFNNLLMVVLGNLDEVKERMTPADPLRSMVGSAIAAAERGAALTQKLLAFARRQPLRPQPIDCNRTVGDMIELLRRTLGERIEIQVALDPELPPAVADVSQVENALLNLSINARDAMPDGGKVIIETSHVQLDADSAAGNPDIVPGDYVMIAVTDTGTGMTPEVMARAFDPFFTTKEVGKGSGLGLSMVYGFAKQSGGHARIYSEVGQGTTVKLYLPVADQPAVVATPGAASATVERARHDESVLVVEDDALVRDTVTRQLLELGYRVREAATPDIALELLRGREAFSLLFTDVVLPGRIGGRQLADEAQRLRPDLKVLFTSGYTQDAIVHQGRLEKGVSLLSKPYKKEALARAVRQILDRLQQRFAD
jgi:signal transduction histidine kinase/ActR/RegA family two-component response regulator